MNLRKILRVIEVVMMKETYGKFIKQRSYWKTKVYREKKTRSSYVYEGEITLWRLTFTLKQWKLKVTVQFQFDTV